MTVPGVDERDHLAVLKPLLRAQFGTETAAGGQPAERVHDLGDVPGADGNTGTMPSIFGVVSLERRYVESAKDGRATRSGWRLTVRCVGRTPNEARWALRAAAVALEGTRIDVDGTRSTQLHHDGGRPVEKVRDAPRYAGETDYTYTL